MMFSWVIQWNDVQVRDILLVVNFNDWGEIWGPRNVRTIFDMHGSSFSGIVSYTSRDGIPELVEGVPSLNLFFCPGGGQGTTFGLWAQICTGLALTAFSGHLGYLVINDDVALSPWNMLAYRPDWLWHKPPVGMEWYYSCLDDPDEKAKRESSGRYPHGGWCHSCFSFSRQFGAGSLGSIHAMLPGWMVKHKTSNYGRPDGVHCSMVDVFYVPGRLAAPFGWLGLITGAARTEVELAQATMWDMVAPRAER
jgi:hypothetical protein